MSALFRSNLLHLPWRPRKSSDQVVVSWVDKTLAFVRAGARKEGGFDIRQMGVERQGAMSDEDFVRRLQSIGLKGRQVQVMLRPG
ncbi:MAG TPA: hypothetical protein PK497_10360, partial [Burkholderiaceae bacterium]|nr:hypothetical protein [Burkholderiaceae bacterium]